MKVFTPFYDPSDLSACVEASMSVAELNARAAGDGIYFPLWRDESQSLGSLYLQTRACSRSFRFGAVGDNTLGCRFRLKNGKEVDLGGRVVKNVVGFDLTRFFAGSLGRLGEPVNLVLRLRPLPEIRRELSLSGGFSELEAFREAFMSGPWVHCVDAFDVEVSDSGMRLALAYACTKDEAPVFESALARLAHDCKLEDAPLPRHPMQAKSELMVPLSQTLRRAAEIHELHGCRVSGFLGQGLLLCEHESAAPHDEPGAQPDWEARMATALDGLE